MKKAFIILLLFFPLFSIANPDMIKAEKDSLLRLARKGDISAQRKVGIIYYTENNYVYALRWLEKAFQKRDAIAAYYIGQIYINGYHSAYDQWDDSQSKQSIALKYFDASANMGYPQAQYIAGVAFYNGNGIKKNEYLGLKYINTAAQSGNPEAISFLKNHNENIDNTTSSPQKSAFSNAESGNPIQQYRMGYMYYKGQGGMVQDMKKALYWFDLAAKNGVAEAAFYLATLYSSPEKGIPTDYNKAIKWYSFAASHSIAEAQYNLALMLMKGEGTPQDYRMAAYWFSKAADADYTDAQGNLGYLYYRGFGVEKEMNTAMQYLEKAAEKDNAAALYTIGVIYYNGDNGEKDPSKAFEYITRSANTGYPVAMYALGYLYSQGEGIPHDDEKANLWYARAAQKGYTKAEKAMTVQM
ncbi:MAG: tetratricopeptide repeat protein [Flavobacteriales bacterium]|nr:tetratricopeptide repeat protein [Flavobacteriales bacterium]